LIVIVVDVLSGSSFGGSNPAFVRNQPTKKAAA